MKRFWSKVNKYGLKKPHMRTRCWLWVASLNIKGYGLFSVGSKTYLAHRFAFEQQHGQVPSFCLHKCDTRSCVRPSHLYSGTKSDNARDRYARNPLRLRGEQHGRAKLTWKAVRRIRRLYASGRWTHLALAQRFNISETPVRDIINRKTWKE